MVTKVFSTKKKTDAQKQRIVGLLEESKKSQERILELSDLEAKNILPLA